MTKYRLLKPISSPLYSFEAGTVKTAEEWNKILGGYPTNPYIMGSMTDWFQRCDTLEDMIEAEFKPDFCGANSWSSSVYGAGVASEKAGRIAAKYLNSKLSEIINEINKAVCHYPISTVPYVQREAVTSIIISHIQ